MSSKSIKRKIRAADGKIRPLADGLASLLGNFFGEDTEDLKEIARDFRKLELKIEMKGGKAKAELKVKPAKAARRKREKKPGKAPDGKAAAAEYRKIKRRMRKNFNSISSALESGKIPDEIVVGAFIDDSKLMTTFKGKGDPLFDKYLDACDDFREAFDRSSLKEMKKKLKAIDEVRKTAHKKFK